MPSHRRHLHYAAAMALEELAAPGSCEDSYEIAGHYRQAARWTLAVPHQLRVARREIDEGNLESAEPQLKRALTDIAALPPGEERRRFEIETQIVATSLAELRGDVGRADELLAGLWPGLKQADSQLSAAALLTRSRLCHRKGQLRKAFASIRLIPRGYKGGAMESFWLLPECFASLAGFVTPEGGTPGMARRQHVLSGPRSGEAEQAAFQALCHAKQEKFAAAYTACNQALQISEDLPDPTCLIVSLQALGLIQIRSEGRRVVKRLAAAGVVRQPGRFRNAGGRHAENGAPPARPLGAALGRGRAGRLPGALPCQAGEVCGGLHRLQPGAADLRGPAGPDLPHCQSAGPGHHPDLARRGGGRPGRLRAGAGAGGSARRPRDTSPP